ncbi:hypothetical protein HDU82_002622 [Entophlyctis luteolus]|nr:hypothetical protein HDU82_002622 [Entophlyctis luteolus]
MPDPAQQPLLERSLLSSPSDDSSYTAFVLAQFGLGKRGALAQIGAVAAAIGLLSLALYVLLEMMTPAPLNVIMMVSDGFGPASQTLARNFHSFAKNLSYDSVLPLDTILVGSSRTRSSDSFVTDSAAGATAFSCALKSYNGAIGVDPEMIPCGTVLEAAKLRGYLTGLVATSRITHATPASFAAHVIDRDMENEIAVQEIGNYSLGRTVDLMFGGGSCHFKPASAGPSSCRHDELDLFRWGATKYGWTSVGNIELRKRLPLLALFTPDHMSYEIDRNEQKEPSLKEMALKALDILSDASKRNRKGFFIMIEGSRIDMAAHSCVTSTSTTLASVKNAHRNDPATHVREILAYNNAVEAVINWVNGHPNTVMISTSDHETGGLSVAHQLGNGYPVYEWYPSALANVQNSTETVANFLASYPNDSTYPQFVIDVVLPQWLGVIDASEAEIAFLTVPGSPAFSYQQFIANMISDRAGLGWATHGHSAVDVNLYAHGHRSDELRGNHENTAIGGFLARVLGVDLKSVTRRLNADGKWWKSAMARGRMAVEAEKDKLREVSGFNKAGRFLLQHFHQHGSQA